MANFLARLEVIHPEAAVLWDRDVANAMRFDDIDDTLTVAALHGLTLWLFTEEVWWRLDFANHRWLVKSGARTFPNE